MATCNSSLKLMLLLLFTAIVWQQLLANASKIAYKKPLFGKLSYNKERRLKQKADSTTTSTSTEFTDWPTPVEFIINTTPRTATSNQEEPNSDSSSSSSISAGSTTPNTNSQVEQATVSSNLMVSSTTASSITTPTSLDNTLPTPPTPITATPTPTTPIPLLGDQSNQPVPCTCGVFLTSQIKNGLPDAPLIHNEMDRVYSCNAIGRKQCQTKCLETIVQHLPNSANIVCAALGHNCHKERAYLFIKNCQNHWVNTNLQAGREYCCKDGTPYRCPLLG